ncbi:MipA/OmpV family protein [Rheinheimera soli]|uniref:Outer membrane scaffolding protein for murein synthesis (MipA/OmpV family) n=1 Tax=Rheinheimera soli TaxID=443616 RepID=A0ABU1W514_9GAMM|nr:MipA/OmpV family protein [Rheinheimera soli]MDR7122793.1 outer membrane scaffolding protein for murein synthesis (MipA/OmpV family) [Rheinheimera soli]
MKLFLTFILVMALHSGKLLADTPQTAAGEWSISLSAGAGKVTTPLSNRDDLQGYLLPAVSYYGERFFIENSFIGYTLFEKQNWYLDLTGSLNDDGFFFELDGINQFGWWDALGMDGGFNSGDGIEKPVYKDIKRNLSYMAGLSFTWLTDLVEVRLSSLADISGVHHGKEHHLSFRKSYHWQKWQFRWHLGTLYKNKKITNYYYNLRPDELGNNPSWFGLPGGLNYFYGVTLSYQLNPQWAVQAFWQKNQLDQDLLRSPLLRSDHYYSRFIGVRYSF